MMLKSFLQKYCPTIYKKTQSMEQLPSVEDRLSVLETAIVDLAEQVSEANLSQ